MTTLLPQSLRAAMALEGSPQQAPKRHPPFAEGGASAASAIARADWVPTQGSIPGNLTLPAVSEARLLCGLPDHKGDVLIRQSPFCISVLSAVGCVRKSGQIMGAF